MSKAADDGRRRAESRGRSPRSSRPGRRIVRSAALLLLGCIAACASQTKRHEAELAELVAWLPGHYDNTAQAEADRAAGREPHEALDIVLVEIYAPMIGPHVFYYQEMAAGDPRRVLAQRLVSFDVEKGVGIVQSSWTLTDPLRWRDAHLDPDLFKGLQPPDVRRVAGCELRWRKEGGRFTGENDRERCRASSRAGGGSVKVESRAELGPDELALSDRAFDDQGRLVQGREDDPFYRFRRK